MKTPFVLAILLFAFTANAGMYKYLDENGEVVYTDEPPYEGAEEIIPPKIQITPAVKYKPRPKEEKPKDEGPTKYSSFKITSPEKDTVIRGNEGNISVVLALQPALNIKQGHYINLLVNGEKKQSKKTTLSFKLENMDRGSHVISAEIRNAKGKLLKSSNSVTVQVFRFSKLQNRSKS